MDKGDMGFAVFMLLLVAGIIACVVNNIKKKKADAEMMARLSPNEREKIWAERAEKQKQLAASAERAREANLQAQKNALASSQYGPINSAMMCPHCQTKGEVRTKSITQKKGVSGGKAAAAVLTGGVSILAVGLSRKEASTQAHCDNCGNTWLF